MTLHYLAKPKKMKFPPGYSGLKIFHCDILKPIEIRKFNFVMWYGKNFLMVFSKQGFKEKFSREENFNVFGRMNERTQEIWLVSPDPGGVEVV